jgi:SAM-dependent methyltransferase
MADYYQKHYAAYHERTFGIDPAPWLEPLAAKLRPGARILDVGCGSGRDLVWLKKRGYQVVGFERSSGLAGLARAAAGCEVIQGDFTDFDFSALAMDAVVMAGVLVHLPHSDLPGIFKNIVRGLINRPGGTGAVKNVSSNPADPRLPPIVLISLKEGKGRYKGADGRTFYLWQDAALRAMFTDCGFTVLEFRRGPSALGTGERWLGYLLERQGD